MSVPQEEQCSLVTDTCPRSHTFLSIQYTRSYFCTDPALRPLAFIGLVTYLLFLFATLGITASDFFCPNLASISNFLGLDENVAGVTFLAFGNGSPDVFSTFSAMRADSGSLAIGELLGAATFIVSVVVGSMSLIKPFRVEKYPFLRDVGFFTVAVSFLLAIAYDGTIRAWEAGVLVALYIVYVFVVVAGCWWERRAERRRLREALIRQEYAGDQTRSYRDFTPYHDEGQWSPIFLASRDIRRRRTSTSFISAGATFVRTADKTCSESEDRCRSLIK